MKMRLHMVSLLAAAVFLPFGPPASASEATLRIYCIDVGQGDSALVIFPDGGNMLIDTGKSSEAYNISDLCGRLGISHFNRLVVTHSDGDHSGGVSYLTSNGFISASTQRFDWTNTSPGQKLYESGDTSVTCVSSNGHVLDKGSTQYGTDSNDLSVGVVVRHRGFDYLSCGDLETKGEDPLGESLSARGWDIDVLKVDHHGSRYSSSLYFLQNVMPEFAAIMVGTNSYGHPTQATLDRLDDASVHVQRIFQTEPGSGGTAANVQAANGQVLIATNGATYTFANEGPGSTSFSYGPFNVDEPVYVEQPPHLLIAEIALDAHRYPETHDWVELYLPPDAPAVYLNSLYITDLDQVQQAATGTVELQPGDVAVLHNAAGPTESYLTGKGANGWWDIYGPYSGTWNAYNDEFAVLTRNTLTPQQSEILDAAVWSNDDGSMYPDQAADGNYFIDLFHWGDPTAGHGRFTTSFEGPAIGPIQNGYARRLTTADTNSVADWTISPSHSQGTPPPTPTPVPQPTPTPEPPPVVLVQTNSPSYSAGDIFQVNVQILPILDRTFDAHAVILGSGVVYSIQFGDYLVPGVRPIAQRIGMLPGGYVGTILQMEIPPGAAGDYQVIVGLSDSGTKVTGVGSTFAWNVAYVSVR